MPLKWIVQNKYKLIAAVIGAYLLIDLVVHKGLVRVLVPKTFPVYKMQDSHPPNNNTLINTNKEWAKAINTIALMNKLEKESDGLECDVYFDRDKNGFDVHHDEDKSLGLNLNDLLQVYHGRGLHASVWLDFKNLDTANKSSSLTELIRLRKKYGLTDKVLVESSKPNLLKDFGDSGFFTAYYTPMFNPYLASDDAIGHWVDSLSGVINNSAVNALSGYYFQYPFLHQYFPSYPILIWSPNDKFSLVNWWYQRKIAADKTVFISLYP